MFLLRGFLSTLSICHAFTEGFSQFCVYHCVSIYTCNALLDLQQKVLLFYYGNINKYLFHLQLNPSVKAWQILRELRKPLSKNMAGTQRTEKSPQ
jgi:hypothetical protein